MKTKKIIIKIEIIIIVRITYSFRTSWDRLECPRGTYEVSWGRIGWLRS